MKSLRRPKKKPDHNSEKIWQALMDTVTDSYLNSEPGEEAADDRGHRQLSLLAEEISMTRLKIQKPLITSDVYETPISIQVNRLYNQGKTAAKFQESTGLKRASVHSYLLYTRAVYKLEDATVTTKRIRKYRERKRTVVALKQEIVVGNTEKVFQIRNCKKKLHNT